jgi:hypothetical protein
MIALAALMLLQRAAPAGPPEEDFEEIQEITVIAQRLRQIGVHVSRDAQGKYQCGLEETTGLKTLDSALCKAVTGCVRKGKDSRDDVRACVDKARPSLLARIRGYLIAERAGAGA